MGVVLFMVISFMGISSSVVGSGNAINHSQTPLFGTEYNNSTGNLLTPVQPLSIHGPPGGGGGGGGSPSTVKVAFYIFDGQGEISLDGVDYSDGSSISLTSGSWYSISAANIGSGFSFYEWLSNGGTVKGSQSSSTTFMPSSSGSLSLILFKENPNDTNNWAGYEEYSSNGLSQASAIIDVPSSISYVNGVWQGAHTSTETVAFWVGLGGDGNVVTIANSALWQAGVSIQMNSSGSMWISAFYEYVGSESISPVHLFNVYPGDVVYVDISLHIFNLADEKGYYTIRDETQGFYASNSINLPTEFYYEYPFTAEWITEDPASGPVNYYVIPDFNLATFQSVQSGNTSGMNQPFVYMFGPVLNEKVTVEWNSETFDQGLTPGTTNSIDFTVSYSQWSP